MKKKLSIIIISMLFLNSFAMIFAQEIATDLDKYATAIWDNVQYGDSIFKITLSGIVGKQIDENQVAFEEYPVKFLDDYEFNMDLFDEIKNEDGSLTYIWNGQGTLIENSIKVIPIVDGATLTIELIDGTNHDFSPGYYKFIDTEKKVICNAKNTSYSISLNSTHTFTKSSNGDFIDAFPFDMNGQKLGLLIVDSSTYKIPTDEEIYQTIKPKSLTNFTDVNIYSKDTFSDVLSQEWYANDVKVSYESGIILGKGNNKFDPEGKITIAEALTMASRTNNIYYGGNGVIENSNYNGYEDIAKYAIENNIITEGQFTNLNKFATRAEIAYLFNNAIAQEEYTQINNINSLPDVDENTLYKEDILNLYNAGILIGSDEEGTFKSDNCVTRAEASAIINRVIKTDNRKQISFN